MIVKLVLSEKAATILAEALDGFSFSLRTDDKGVVQPRAMIKSVGRRENVALADEIKADIQRQLRQSL